MSAPTPANARLKLALLYWRNCGYPGESFPCYMAQKVKW